MNLISDRKRRTIPLFIFLVFITISGLFNPGCEEESSRPREYPRFTAMEVINVSDSGATFISDLYSMGTEKITECGFLWGPNKNSPLSSSNRIYLSVPETTGQVSADIRSALEKDKIYYARAFVRTAERIVYGPVTSFYSLGVNAPVIYRFEPDSAIWGDTVLITGKNFSYLSGENFVFLNEMKCSVAASTDTTLAFIVGTEIRSAYSSITVQIAEKRSAPASDSLRTVFPFISDFYPKQAQWGDSVTIKGRYLKLLNISIFNSVKIGTTLCPIKYSSLTDTLLKIIIPSDLTAQNAPLSLYLFGWEIYSSQKFTLMPPVFSFFPAEAAWKSIITLKGRFNPVKSRNNIKIGGLQAAITYCSRDSIKITVPDQLVNRKNPVLLESSPFNIIAADSFLLPKPFIRIFSPSSGLTSSTVTIKGKFLNNPAIYNFTKVKFGDLVVSNSVYNDSTLAFTVPSGISNGQYRITVYAGNQSVVSDAFFTVKNPVIRDFTPKTATFNDEIKIRGENFANNVYPYVYFGNFSGTSTVSMSDTLIIVKVPDYVDSVPAKIHLSTTYFTINSQQNFVLQPPVISGITPDPVSQGLDITISGTGFNPVMSKNSVYWLDNPITIKTASASQIVATLPAVMPRNAGKIYVKAGGYKRGMAVGNSTSSQWWQSFMPTGISWSSYNDYVYKCEGFSLNGKAYLINKYSGALLSFDPLSGSFVSLGTHNLLSYWGISYCVSRDTAWMMGSNIGLSRYSPSANIWISTGAAPTTGYNYNGAFFSLNDRLYYGLRSTSAWPAENVLTTAFWIYNPGSRTWSPRKSLPAITTKGVVAYFTLNNKGYVLFYDNKFVEYNPATDAWTQLANYPGTNAYQGRAAFVIDGKAYVGGGRMYSSSVYSDALYVFDPGTGLWSFSCTIPYLARYNSASFSLNNKGYIVSGFQNTGTLMRDILEFDPAYSGK